MIAAVVGYYVFAVSVIALTGYLAGRKNAVELRAVSDDIVAQAEAATLVAQALGECEQAQTRTERGTDTGANFAEPPLAPNIGSVGPLPNSALPLSTASDPDFRGSHRPTQSKKTLELIQQYLEPMASQEGVNLVAVGGDQKVLPSAQPEIDQNATANAERIAERERRIKAGDTEYLAAMHAEAIADLVKLIREGVESGLLATAEKVSSQKLKTPA